MDNYIISNAGMMSDNDIKDAMAKRELVITPFDADDNHDRKKLTPAGFNFSFSEFIVSNKNKNFIELHEESAIDAADPDFSMGKYNDLVFYLEPGDTALALTRESICVSNTIAGTFHSKVTYVSQGLGHVSTTLDPYWQGQLLISINNPSDTKLRVLIGKIEKNRSNGNTKKYYKTFITLCLFRLISPSSKNSDNDGARLKILYDLLEANKVEKTQQFSDIKMKIFNLNNSMKSGAENVASQWQVIDQALKNVALSEKGKEEFINNHKCHLDLIEEIQPEIETLSKRRALEEEQRHSDGEKKRLKEEQQIEDEKQHQKRKFNMLFFSLLFILAVLYVVTFIWIGDPVKSIISAAGPVIFVALITFLRERIK